MALQLRTPAASSPGLLLGAETSHSFLGGPARGTEGNGRTGRTPAAGAQARIQTPPEPISTLEAALGCRWRGSS